MNMNNRELLRLWKWEDKDGPKLSEIDVSSESCHLFYGRKPLIESTVDIIRNKIKRDIKNVFLVCGPPGVGKSTFIEHLLQNIGHTKSKRISCNPLTSGIITDKGRRLTASALAMLFSKVEIFLNNMLKSFVNPHEPDEITRNLAQIEINYKEENNDEKLQRVIDMISAVLVEKCEHINTPKYSGIGKSLPTNKIPQHYLAIDDVDYLSPSDQIVILTILCHLVGVTINPSIIYTARPVAAGIAKSKRIDLSSGRVSDPIFVEPIDPNDVIKVRITNNGQWTDITNPFLDENLNNFLKKYSSNNLRTALDLVVNAVDNGHKVLHKPQHGFSREEFIKTMFRSKVENKEQMTTMSDYREPRRLVNLFRKYDEIDFVPPLYVLMLTIDKKDKIRIESSSFTNVFNEINNNLVESKSKKLKMKWKRIFGFLKSCHSAHLIRRVMFINEERYLAANEAPSEYAHLEGTYMALTSCGIETLRLTKDPIYQELTGVCYWPGDFTSKVNNMPLRLNLREDGDYILKDANE